MPYTQSALSLTAPCAGVTNFLLGAIAELTDRDKDASVSATFLVWLGCGLVGVAAALYFRVSGRGFKGIPSRGVGLIPALAACGLCLGTLTLKLGLAFDVESKVWFSSFSLRPHSQVRLFLGDFTPEIEAKSGVSDLNVTKDIVLASDIVPFGGDIECE
jgi:hypothetical protein